MWFENSNVTWDEKTSAYTDGINTVSVWGIPEVTLKYGTADVEGVFLAAASEKIFEDKNKGFIA